MERDVTTRADEKALCLCYRSLRVKWLLVHIVDVDVVV